MSRGHLPSIFSIPKGNRCSSYILWFHCLDRGAFLCSCIIMYCVDCMWDLRLKNSVRKQNWKFTSAMIQLVAEIDTFTYVCIIHLKNNLWLWLFSDIYNRNVVLCGLHDYYKQWCFIDELIQGVENQLERETDLPSSISDDFFAFPKPSISKWFLTVLWLTATLCCPHPALTSMEQV